MKINKNTISGILLIAIVVLGILFLVLLYTCESYMTKVDEMKGMLIERESELYVANESIDAAQKELKASKENIISLKEELDAAHNELDAANKERDIAIENLETVNTTLDELKKSEYKFVYLGDFKITHYCNEKYEHVCGYGDGLTATGTKVAPGDTVAIDPAVIPYGTKIYIEGYGWRTALDCGGSVDGKHIDVAVNTHSEAMSMGVRHKDVWALVKK